VGPTGSLRGPLAPYIGNVATRGYVADRSTSGTVTQGMARVVMFTRDLAAAPRPLIPINWYVDQPTNNEVAIPGEVRVKASIEYPLGGPRVPLTFGGRRVGTFEGGDTAVPDAPDLAIPAMSAFAVNLWLDGGTSVLAYTGYRSYVPGEEFQFGATAPDLVDEGTPAKAGQPISLAVLGVLAETSRRSFLVVGDSIARGAMDVADSSHGDTGGARLVGHARAYCNAGIFSTRAKAFTAASAARRIALAQYHSDVLLACYGTNDLTANDTAAQIAASLAGIVGLFHWRPVHVATLPPRTTGTWTAEAGAGQTAVNTEAQRVALNALIRSGGVAGAARVIDWADELETRRDSGLWQALMTPDGIHPNGYGGQATQRAYGAAGLLAD